MASVDFDREAFAPQKGQTGRAPARMLGLVLFIVGVTALAFLGYKLLSNSNSGQNATAAADSQTSESVQQQLAKIEKRLDQLERRRKGSEPEAGASQPANATTEKTATKKTVYTFAPSGSAKTQSAAAAPGAQGSQTSHASPGAASTNDSVADREAWQATTNRLADVVGVVGSQEGEIAEAREQLNTLLAQTRRNAIPFELRRGRNPQPVGPVSMALKGSDARSQRYTLCIYVNNKCVELKDRAVHEVVVFVLSKNTAPFEVVATKILRDQIVGYLEVPTDKTTP